MLAAPNDTQHADQYLYADLPQVGVVNGRHEESLGNVIEVSRISHCRSLGTPTVVLREGSKVLVIQLTFPSIQACIIGRSSVKVTGIDVPSVRSQEVAYNANLSGTWSHCQGKWGDIPWPSSSS